MLVFTRRSGETFVLYPDPKLDPNTTIAELFARGPIEITVTETKLHHARIGVDAPPQIHVYRSELLPLTQYEVVCLEPIEQSDNHKSCM